MTLGDAYMVAASDRQVVVTWRPDVESREAAERRAREAVTGALDGIAADWEQAGWDFPDTASKSADHLRWLYLRLRHGWSYARIATEAGLDTDYSYVDPAKAVQRAVKRIAQVAGVGTFGAPANRH